MKNKIYIGLITQAGNDQYFNWYNMASKYVDGLAITWHGSKDGGYDTLNKNKGCGFIIESEYWGHHAHSMNNWLLNPAIRPGSWIIIRDTLEQCNENWLKNIKQFCFDLEKSNINTVCQYSKFFMFKKYEHMFFSNTPHWTLNGFRHHILNIENQKGFENPRDYSYSIRNDIRSKSHWVNHFLSYYLIDGSNHLLLGRENNQQEFQIHEQVRYKFKEYIEKELGVESKVNSLINYWKNNELNYQMKWFIGFERILNDAYCFNVLNHSVEDILERHKTKAIFEIK